MSDQVLAQVTSKWWTFLLRGAVALAVAIFIFLEPETAQIGLVYLVGAYFIVSGFVAIASGVWLTGFGQSPLLVLSGIAQLALGILMLAKPGLGPLALAYLVAIWAISTGIVEIGSGLTLRKVVSHAGWWILLGLVTIALGAYIVVQPELGVFALVYTVAIYAALAAGALFALAFGLKSAGSKLERGSEPAAAAGAH